MNLADHIVVAPHGTPPEPNAVYTDFHTHSTETEPDVLALRSVARPCSGLFSLELHPWTLPEIYVGIPEIWRTALPRAAAVGEIGMDALRGPALDVQEQYFREALELAAQRDLPVVIHAVQATGRVLDALRPYPKMRKLLHGFRGSERKLVPWLEAGFQISCGTIPPKTLPLAHLGLESDAARGTLRELYAAVAMDRNIELAALQKQMAQNLKLFLNKDTL